MSNAVLTFDIDWAPDFTINFVTDRLIAQQVRSTWFVTHMSPAIERLRRYPDLFELGIHPNFLPASTHGDTPEMVLRHCMKIVPEAISVRTHQLVQSTPLLEQILTHTPIKADASLFLPYTPHLRPVEHWGNGRMLLRIPCFWADDVEMGRITRSWSLKALLSIGEGLKVFAFHPIHIYLNSGDRSSYRALKQKVPIISEATPTALDPFVQFGEGTRTVFADLVAHLATAGQSSCIRDIHRCRQ